MIFALIMYLSASLRLLLFSSLLLTGLPASAQEQNPCLEKDICKSYGRCTYRSGECVAATDADCHGSGNCKHYGQCSLSDLGYCTAKTNADCAASRCCKEEGACIAKDGTCQREIVKVTDANRHTAVAVTYHVVCIADGPCLPTPVSVGHHFFASCDSVAFAQALSRASMKKPDGLPHDVLTTRAGDSVACYEPGSKQTRNWGFVVKRGKILTYLRRASTMHDCRGYIRGLCKLCGQDSVACKQAPRTRTSPGKCKYDAALLDKATEGDRLERIPGKLLEAICQQY